MPQTLNASNLGESSLGRLLEEENKQVLKRDESRKGSRAMVVVVMESEARLVKVTVSRRLERLDCGFWVNRGTEENGVEGTVSRTPYQYCQIRARVS